MLSRPGIKGLFPPLAAAAVAVALLAPGQAAHAQGTSGPTVTDSRVGYIDDAIPGNVFRLRFDAGYDFRRPTRAEWFYPKGEPPGGPGLPEPETSIDYQELSAYVEALLTDDFSAFLEVPARFINPVVNDNTAGLADLNVGFKWAFHRTQDTVSSFQLRVYAPTGDADRGLGTHHVSLEPAFLFYGRLTEKLALEAELRYFIPVGGTDFAGNIIRYGAGLSYTVWDDCRFRVAPVAEFVGWQVLDGQESFVHPSGVTEITEAAGDAILNVKFGVRLGLSDVGDLYLGYGVPLTGHRWYDDTFRMEVRLFY